jgi:hypothetical protein
MVDIKLKKLGRPPKLSKTERIFIKQKHKKDGIPSSKIIKTIENVMKKSKLKLIAKEKAEENRELSRENNFKEQFESDSKVY